MPQESLSEIIQFRVTPTEMQEIKSICYDKREQWNRDYSVSDFVRDAVALMKSYHNCKDSLLSNRDIIPVLLERLSNGRK